MYVTLAATRNRRGGRRLSRAMSSSHLMSESDDVCGSSCLSVLTRLKRAVVPGGARATHKEVNIFNPRSEDARLQRFERDMNQRRVCCEFPESGRRSSFSSGIRIVFHV